MRGIPSTTSLRLSRVKSNEGNSTTTASSNTPISPYEQPICASYDDLKRPEARQLLRDQLTGTFAEPSRQQEPKSSGKMALKDKLMRRASNLEVVGVHADAKSSSSTVDSVGARGLSAVPETDTETIDIERAIALLQELKKTASPNELVALHRALLPTKEVETISSPQVSTFNERPPKSPVLTSSQRRAGLFPGLATRGGPSADPLRKPNESPFEPQKKAAKQSGRWFPHTHADSISSLAALDLSSTARAVTPSDFAYAHTGAFEPGTLRITNGAASPEPSIRGFVSHEQTTAGDYSPDSGFFEDVSTRPALEPIRGRVSIDVLPGRNVSQESRPIRDRIMNSDKAQQQRKDRANRLSSISTASGESMIPVPSKTPPPKTPTRLSGTMLRQSPGRESVSPSPTMSDAHMPRFQQRWSHRASHIPAEDAMVGDGGLKPYEQHQQPNDQQNALLSPGNRLSTVYDSDGDDAASWGDIAEAALSKLVGEPRPEDKTRPSEDIGSTRSGDEQTQPSEDAQADKAPSLRKSDSGYESDAARRTSRRNRTAQVGPSRNPASYSHSSTQSAKRLDSFDETAEVQSLYTFDEMLQNPALLDATKTTPSPKTAKKKGSSLLRLHTLTRSEVKSSAPLSIPEPVSSEWSSETVATLASIQSAANETQRKVSSDTKQPKKLQKPIPAAVKKQRKEEMRKLKEASANMIMPPLVPDDVFTAHAERLQATPSSASLHRTYSTVETTDVEEDDTRRRSRSSREMAEFSMEDPAHASSTDAVETRRPSPSRQRSKSRGRRRVTSGRQPNSAADGSADEKEEVHSSWFSSNPLRRRSKDKSRTRSQSNHRSSLDAMLSRTFLGPEPQEHEDAMSPGEETMPAFSDFSSVARTLGAGSYDISTNQFKRVNAPVAGATQHQLQSPWAITTGLAKGKTTKGMNSEMASELARMKSRDLEKNEPWHERPRMVFAAPAKKGRSASSETMASVVSVEDRFPGWQGKDATREASPQRPKVQHRPHSMYAESIPPMPEMPAAIAVKVSKLDEAVARKRGNYNLNTSPGGSSRNSAEETGLPMKSALAKRSPQSVRVEDEKRMEESKSPGLLHPALRPLAGTKRAHTVNVMVRELNGSNSSNSSLSISAGGDEEAVEEEPSSASPTHDAKHSGWPGWEQQAKLWKERRESLGQAMRQPIEEEEESLPTAESPPLSRKPSMASLATGPFAPIRRPSMDPSHSPAIVVSRYITPLSSEHLARNSRPSDAAAQHADAYRGLLGDENDKENRPAQRDVPRTDSTLSAGSTTSTFVTVKSWDPRPAKPDVPRTDTAVSGRSLKSYRTTTSVVTTTSTVHNNNRNSSGQHTRTASGAYVPYSPSQQSAAEYSRAHSLARLNGISPPLSTNTSSLSISRLGDPNDPRSGLSSPGGSRQDKGSPDGLTDRYSGGLDYGWQRGTGFSGSAGTRSNTNEGKRTSVRMSENYGLDLSDVPVFLRKMS